MPHPLSILLTVFWLSVVRSDERGVYYDAAPRSWHASSTNCQQLGAWEDTDFSTEGFRVLARPSEFPLDQVFWIGANMQQTPSFTLLGCFETTGSTKGISLKTIAGRGNPTYKCSTFCSNNEGITAIGISKTNCYCYTDVEKYRKVVEECIYETFPEYPGELFGGPNDGSVVVYQYNNQEPSLNSNEFGNCAAVKYLGTIPVRHQFTSCQNRIGFMCSNGRVFRGELPWTEAVKQCGTCSLKTDIIGHYTGLTDSHKNHEFWTGFYRQSYVYWSPPGGLDTGGKNSNLHHCIGVKVNEDGTLYPVTYPHDCSESLPSICEKSTKRDGGWSDWSDWSECYFVNGMDKKSKTRTCTNPSPRHGGKYCEGDDKIERPCLEPQFVGDMKEKTVPSKEDESKQRK